MAYTDNRFFALFWPTPDITQLLMFAWSGPLKLQISVIVPLHLQILLRYVIVVTANVLFRSGGADKGAAPSSSQPSKRLQQTQAQVDEVCVIDLFFNFMSFY